MIAATVIIAVIMLIALLRFGVSAEYSAEGIVVTMYIAFYRFTLYPTKEVSVEKALKKEKKKEKKKLKKQKKMKVEEPEEKKQGTLKTVLDLLPEIMKGLGRLRRKLLVKKLTVYLSLANEDPYKAAMSFGSLNSAIGIVAPLLEKGFKIKRRDYRTAVDFTATEHLIYINSVISIAVWEAVYVTWAVVPSLLKTLNNNQMKSTRKDVKENGQTPNKRVDGNHDAEGTGDDRRQHDSGGAGHNS